MQLHINGDRAYGNGGVDDNNTSRISQGVSLCVGYRAYTYLVNASCLMGCIFNLIFLEL